jgi:pantoate--beta-alanine ligase
MDIFRTLNEAADPAIAGCALVPTMGALHAGHQALIRKAREVALPGKRVVVSIFVNPTQFGPNEDYTRYPRMLEKDVEAAASAGAQMVFAPEVDTMYPPGQVIAVPTLPAVATQPHLEDAVRPTHFSGVCQVVGRLFDLIKPAAAIFGEKDYQQLQVVRAMVQQESHRWPGLEIVPLATVREHDGLAMSSRNAYLKNEERQRARALWQAIAAGKQEASVSAVEGVMHSILEEHGLIVDYAVVRDARTLMPIKTLDQPARALIAARLGSVRLIDNAGIR